MDVPERIHIIPLGYEYDRVVEPPRRLNADRVILLAHTDQDAAPDYHGSVREDLQRADIDVEELGCNIFDLYTCLGEIAELATKFDDDEVYVNLATGSKVTAIAGMIACMATGATPYYVSAERYGPEKKPVPEHPVSFGVRDIEELSRYPIDPPSKQAISVLSYLDQEGPAAKRDVIEFAEENDLAFIVDSETDSLQGKYRRLDSNVMRHLEDDGYVTLTERGRRSLVDITEDGENTLQAFQYLIE